MLTVLLIAAQVPIAPVVAPGAISTLKPATPSEVCAAGTPEGIIVQGGLQPSASSGIIVQGGKTAGDGIIVQGGKAPSSGIIVQGGLQPSASSEAAATEKCEQPKG
jgi:hypothetical protein